MITYDSPIIQIESEGARSRLTNAKQKLRAKKKKQIKNKQTSKKTNLNSSMCVFWSIRILHYDSKNKLTYECNEQIAKYPKWTFRFRVIFVSPRGHGHGQNRLLENLHSPSRIKCFWQDFSIFMLLFVWLICSLLNVSFWLLFGFFLTFCCFFFRFASCFFSDLLSFRFVFS